MREIEKIANEKFEGDIPKAIEYAYRTWGTADNENMRKIYEEFTDEDKIIADEVIRNLAMEQSGGKVSQLERISESLNMSDEEIMEEKKNPFINKFLISFDCLLLSVIIPAAIVLCFGLLKTKIGNFIMGIQLVFIVMSAVESAIDLSHIIKFNKAKKILKEIYQ